MRRIAIARIVGLLLAIVVGAAALWQGRVALRQNADFNRWQTDRPMQLTVDLSQPSVTTVPFRQSCSTSHGEAIFLLDDLLADAAAKALRASDGEVESYVDDATIHQLRRLVGSVEVCDRQGAVVATAEFNDRTIRYSEGRILLASLTPFAKGDYLATIRIEEGATGWGDRQPTLTAEYQLCGLELLPAFFSAVGAAVVGLFSLTCALCVLPGLCRHGIWQSTARERVSAIVPP